MISNHDFEYQASRNVDVLKDHEAVKQLGSILKVLIFSIILLLSKLKAGLTTVEQVDIYNFLSTDECARLQGSWPSLCLAIGQVCTCRATDRLRIRIF